MGKKKRQQYNYPLYNFRLPSEKDKERLAETLERVHAMLNKGRDPDREYAVKKADILLRALEYGLEAIENKRIAVKPRDDGNDE